MKMNPFTYTILVIYRHGQARAYCLSLGIVVMRDDSHSEIAEQFLVVKSVVHDGDGAILLTG